MTENEIYGDRYRIEDAIGDGGMARVYRALDTRLGRVVALKILREQFTNEPEFVERFRQEARLAAALAHPNIVGVYDVGADHDQYFMVMEYVAGQNLKAVIARESPMPMETVISFMRQLSAALDYAHSNGVIHRDIKPENILVTERREVKVGDFGIARALAGGTLTTTGTVLGSVAYLSPEQASGQPATAESDLYSAGMVLYEMLTGRVPFSGPNPVAVAMAQVNDPPPSPRTFVPDMSPVVEAVVLKAIAKDPADRFHSGYELIAALTSPVPPSTARQRRVPPVVTAASAPTMVAGPGMMAVSPLQRPRRGNGGALAALLSTAALLIAAVLVGRSLTGGGSSATATATASTTAVTAPGPKPTSTIRVIVIPTVAGPSTPTFVVSPVANTPVPTATVQPTDTPLVTDTPIDTATPIPSVTPAAPTDTPAVTDTAAAGTATPVGTGTPASGTATPTPGTTHGATVDLVTAKAIGAHFAPVGITNTFAGKSTTIYAVALVHGKAKGDSVLFLWHYPDGSTFPYNNTVVAPYDGDITAYAELNPQGPGNYSVTTSINGHILGTANFAVTASQGAAATDTPTGQ